MENEILFDTDDFNAYTENSENVYSTVQPSAEDYYVWNSNFNTFGIVVLFGIGCLCGILLMDILWKRSG